MQRSREMLVLWVALAAAGTVTLGCSHGRAAPEAPSAVPPPANPPPAESPEVPAEAASAEGEARAVFTLYFASREYVETGQESAERLIAETITLEPALAAAGNERLAAALVHALGEGPTSATALPVIPARVQIRSVHVREGIAEVDLARAGLSGGSLEEELLVQSIVRTLTQLPELHAVRFLVEGKPTETLMGHVSTAQPLTASD